MAVIVGLTGGIASGKSVVSKAFERLGAYVIDADQLAREVVKPGTQGWRETIIAFGEGYLLPNGSLDRRKLAKKVFSDQHAKRVLESIIHPKVLKLRDERLKEILGGTQSAVVIFEVPLLIEKGLYNKMVDRVIVVWAPREMQIQRLMERGGLTIDEAQQRLENQMSLEEKLKYAHYIIDNSGSLQDTLRQVKEIYTELERLAKGSAGSSPTHN